MNILTNITISLSLILLGAHHLRFGDTGLAAAHVVLAGLVFTRREWVRIPVLVALAWGAWIWADSTVGFIRVREMLGADWGRLALIMGAVAVVDFVAFVLTMGAAGRGWFRRTDRNAFVRGVVFVAICFGLSMAQAKVSFPILLLDRYAPGWGWLEIVLLALYGQWIASLMIDPRTQPVVRRRIWAGFSAVFFLQLVLGLFGVTEMLMTGRLHLPVPALILAGPVFRGGGFFMLILFGVTLVLVGPAWCSHLCYIGAWDDSASRFGRGKPGVLSRRTVLVFRLAVLGLVLIAAYGLRLADISWVLAGFLASAFGLLGVFIMLTLSRKKGTMVHCTTYCPMGIVANLFGRLSPWRLKIGRDCTGCNACFSRCRYSALDEAALESGRPGLSCTLCGDCVGACRHGQIEYEFPGLTAEKARIAFIATVVSLHAIFLGVARM